MWGVLRKSSSNNTLFISYYRSLKGWCVDTWASEASKYLTKPQEKRWCLSAKYSHLKVHSNRWYGYESWRDISNKPDTLIVNKKEEKNDAMVVNYERFSAEFQRKHEMYSAILQVSIIQPPSLNQSAELLAQSEDPFRDFVTTTSCQSIEESDARFKGILDLQSYTLSHEVSSTSLSERSFASPRCPTHPPSGC